jgi:high-affinity nickel-transport protein
MTGDPPRRPREAPLRVRAGLILTILFAANLAAWLWALQVSAAYPMLVGSALLAYGLGLRHALDADHIAAIDNVTRRLTSAGARPAGVGFFFSLGHSTVVVAATIGVALAAGRFKAEFATLQAVGGWIGALVSTAFLLIMAVLNVFVFSAAWRALRRTRGEGLAPSSEALDAVVGGGGLMSRVLRPAFQGVGQSWLMYPIGLLFGLGFDTATEIGILGLSAAQAARGIAIWSILVFPALFAAAMALVDTLEALFMLRAYGWASVRPQRRLYYSLTVTALSVLVAAAVGVSQLGGLMARFDAVSPSLGAAAGWLGQHSGLAGVLITAAFALTWATWSMLDRAPRAQRARGGLKTS